LSPLMGRVRDSAVRCPIIHFRSSQCQGLDTLPAGEKAASTVFFCGLRLPASNCHETVTGL
ncbi:hypothetical protein V6O07_13600, partial [Arthrospira platensis SPKY2]